MGEEGLRKRELGRVSRWGGTEVVLVWASGSQTSTIID